MLADAISNAKQLGRQMPLFPDRLYLGASSELKFHCRKCKKERESIFYAGALTFTEKSEKEFNAILSIEVRCQWCGHFIRYLPTATYSYPR